MTKANEVPLPDELLRSTAYAWAAKRSSTLSDAGDLVRACAKIRGLRLDPLKILASCVAEEALEHVFNATGGGTPKSLVADRNAVAAWQRDMAVRAMMKAARAFWGKGKEARVKTNESRAEWRRRAIEAAATEIEKQRNAERERPSAAAFFPGVKFTRGELVSGIAKQYDRRGTFYSTIGKELEKDPRAGLERLRQEALGLGCPSVATVEKAARRVMARWAKQARALEDFFRHLDDVRQESKT